MKIRNIERNKSESKDLLLLNGCRASAVVNKERDERTGNMK